MCFCEIMNGQVKAERGQSKSSVDFTLVFRANGEESLLDKIEERLLWRKSKPAEEEAE